MIRTKILLSVFLLSSVCSANAQTMYGKVGVPSDWGKIGPGSDLVNVDLYTGTGSVNIPIFNYSLNGIDLGVSLSYDAKGIKVEQAASSVGLGWSLNAAGSITREVKGIEDEVTTPAEYSSTDHMEGRIVPGAVFGSYYQSGNPVAIDDQEFDLFHIDLCGRSLTLQFYLDGSALKYITYPKSEIKVDLITKDYAPQSGDIMTYTSSNINSGVLNGIGEELYTKVLTFNITDEQGNKFYFERGELEYKSYDFINSLLISGQSGLYYATNRWDLVKVITANGFTVNYEYKRTFINDRIENITQRLAPGNPLAYTGNYGGGGTHGTLTWTSNPIEMLEEKFMGVKTHLSKITYPNGVEVKFDLDKSDDVLTPNVARCDCIGDFRLRNITIESKYDNNVANSYIYVLNHSYFNSPKYGVTGTEINYSTQCLMLPYYWTGVPAYLDPNVEKAKHWREGTRLKLKSITRYGLDGTTGEQYYSFEYNAQPLPYRFASQKDFYGYFNGYNSTTPFLMANLDYHNEDYYPNSSSIYPINDLVYLSIPKGDYHDQIGSGWQSSYDIGTVKTHNHDTMQAWVLKKIKNGLGGTIEIGYTDYTLSNHDSQYKYTSYGIPSGTPITEYAYDYSELEGQTVNDGLVVGSIKQTNIYSNDHDINTVYEYEGGQRFNRGGYSWYPHINGGKVYHSYWISPNDYYNGSNHGFSKVTKRITGYNNEKLETTVYHFSNLLTGAGNLGGTGPTETNMYRRTGFYYHTAHGNLAKYNMGQLQKMESYDENNYILSKEEYSYQEIDETPNVTLYDRISFTHFHGPVLTNPNVNPEYWDNSGVVHELYFPLNYKLKLLSTKTTTAYMYDNSSTQRQIAGGTTYDYDSHHNLVTQTSTDSKGNIYSTKIWYNYKYKEWYATLPTQSPATLDHIEVMCNAGWQYPISTEVWKENNGVELISFGCSSPEIVNGILKFPSAFTSIQTAPLAESAVFPLSGITPQPSSVINRGKAVDYSKNNVSDVGTNLMLTSSVTLYDNFSNPLEVWSNNKKEVNSYIWDTRLSKKIAEVANAVYDDIAFTSFEGATTLLAYNVADYNKGNWEFDKDYCTYYTSVPDQKVMTGRYAYRLKNSYSIVKSKPLQAKEYIISFWGTGEENEQPLIEIFDGSFSQGVVSYTTYQNKVEKAAGRNWYLYTARFTPNAGENIQISYTNSQYDYYIDELRLHPADAVMASYSYDPLIGVTASNDASNYISYTEYDVQGRYFRTRDMRGKIVEQVETRIQDDDNSSSSGNGSSGGGGNF